MPGCFTNLLADYINSHRWCQRRDLDLSMKETKRNGMAIFEKELAVELKTCLWNLNHSNAFKGGEVPLLFSVFLIFKVR